MPLDIVFLRPQKLVSTKTLEKGSFQICLENLEILESLECGKTRTIRPASSERF